MLLEIKRPPQPPGTGILVITLAHCVNVILLLGNMQKLSRGGVIFCFGWVSLGMIFPCGGKFRGVTFPDEI